MIRLNVIDYGFELQKLINRVGLFLLFKEVLIKLSIVRWVLFEVKELGNHLRLLKRSELWFRVILLQVLESHISFGQKKLLWIDVFAWIKYLIDHTLCEANQSLRIDLLLLFAK